MSESHHDHHEYVVLDRVDDAVVTHANAKPRSTLKGPRSRRARIMSEQSDSALNATAGLRIQLA